MAAPCVPPSAPPATERRARRLLAALLFAGLVCLHFSNWTPDAGPREDYDPTLVEQLQRGAEGSVLRELGLLLVGAAAGLSFLRRGQGPAAPRGLDAVGVMLVVVAVYGLASVAWAELPILSAKRWLAAVLLGAGAAAAGRRLALHGLVRLVFAVTLFEAVFSLLYELATGACAPFVDGYRFSGGVHPNAQALVCALLVASAFALHRVASRRVERAGAALGVALGSGLLLLTRSRTTLAGLLIAAAVILLTAPGLSRRKALAAGGAALLLVLLLLSPAVRSSALSAVLLGRDLDTDRTPIWLDCLEYVRARPVLGYGFNGFWTPSHIEEVAALEKWGVAEAHSSYLEVLLDGGGVGLALVGAVLAASLVLASRRWRATAAAGDGFVFAALVFAALHGLLESGTVRPSLVMFVAVASIARAGAARLPAAVRRFAFRPGALVPLPAAHSASLLPRERRW